MRRADVLARVSAEIDRAYAKHGRRKWGRHEFYGIMLEEVEEAWRDIQNDVDQDQLEKEIVQIAAVCVRYIERGDRSRPRTTEAPKVLDLMHALRQSLAAAGGAQ